MTNFSFTFSPSGLNSHELCMNISLLSDRVVEGIENFFVVIETGDSSVSVSQSRAIVRILDGSGKILLDKFRDISNEPL